MTSDTGVTVTATAMGTRPSAPSVVHEGTYEPKRYSSSRLGAILVRRGKLKPRDCERVLNYAERKQLRFGEAALKLRLVTRTDIQHAIAEQFDYPYLSKGEGGHSKQLVTAYEPFSPTGEKLRNLRAQLLLHWKNADQKTLAVLSPDDPTNSSVIAANLAVACSQSGSATLLVDCDMRRAAQRQFFRANHRVGLSEMLMRRAGLQDAVHRVADFRNLSILPAGTLPPNPGDLLVNQDWSDLVVSLRNAFDIIIFDAPAYGTDTSAEMVARVCGNALIVLQQGRTYLADAKALVKSLEAMNAQVVGSVMTTF